MYQARKSPKPPKPIETIPIETALSLQSEPEKARKILLWAVRALQDVLNAPADCQNKNCRTAGKCQANSLSGDAHPCGGPWREEHVVMLGIFSQFASKFSGEGSLK